MSLEWMLIRGSGLAAFTLLAASTIWGLVLSLGVLPRSVKNLTILHESLSVGALLATLVHMAGLLVDEFIGFDLPALLVPGRSSWRPLAVGWGIVAFYGMVLIVASFYARKSIGQAQWRALHYGSFGVFLGALIHGLTAGTDSRHPAVFGLYLASATAVVVLVVVRIAMAGADAARAAKASPAIVRSEAPGPAPSQPPKRDRAAMQAAAKVAAGAATFDVPRQAPTTEMPERQRPGAAANTDDPPDRTEAAVEQPERDREAMPAARREAAPQSRSEAPAGKPKRDREAMLAAAREAAARAKPGS